MISDPGVASENVTAASTADASIRSKMRSGVLWWGLGNAVSRVLRFAAQFLLIWLLVPAELGLVAMTTAFLNVLQMVSEFGVGIAVIQKKDATDGYVHTAFWLNLAASLIILAATWFAAPWIAKFYRADEITWLVRITSLSFPITALRTIPGSLLRRRMQFGLNSALETAWNGISGALMVVFAACGASYWSLVIPSMIVGLVMTPFWFSYAQWKPAFVFDRREFTDLFHYAKHLVGASLLSLILANAGFVIAGHLLGKDAAGLFNVASVYSAIILINYAWLIGNVSLSGFAAKQNDHGALRSGFMRVYELLVATTLPIHVFGIVLAPLLFTVFMPERYQPALTGFQYLLAFAGLRSCGAHIAAFYNAVNKAYINLYWLLISTPVCIPIMYLACRHGFESGGVQDGLDALARATALSQGFFTIGVFVIAKYVVGWAEVKLLRCAMPYVVATALGAGLAYGIAYAGSSYSPELPVRVYGFVVLVIATAAGAAAYAATLYFTARPKLALLIRDALPKKVRDPIVYRFLPQLRDA